MQLEAYDLPAAFLLYRKLRKNGSTKKESAPKKGRKKLRSL